MNPASSILIDLVAADLELAYDFLCAGNTFQARHELTNAIQRISEIEALSLTENLTTATQQLFPIADPAQEPVIELPPHEQGTNSPVITAVKAKLK